MQWIADLVVAVVRFLAIVMGGAGQVLHRPACKCQQVLCMYTYTFYASCITQNSCPEAAQLIALGSQMHHMMLHQIAGSFIYYMHQIMVTSRCKPTGRRQVLSPIVRHMCPKIMASIAHNGLTS